MIDFRKLQDEVTDLKKEANSNSKFRKILRIIPTIKHSLIASTNEKIDRRILETHKRLQEIDAVIVKMGQKSSTLQKIVKEEIAITAHTVQKKLVNSITSEVVNNTKNKLNELKISAEEWKKAAIRVYNPYELRELENQSLALLGIRANINELLNNNANIPQLPTLQKELNVTLNSLHKSFGERIKDLWSKIKSVFKDSNTQKLQKNTLSNSKIISDIDKNLEKVLTKIEKSADLRKAKLNSQLHRLSNSRHYHSYEFEIDELDEKLALALIDAGKSKQSQSTYLSSSTPVQDNNNFIEHEYDEITYYHTQKKNDNQPLYSNLDEMPKKVTSHRSAPNLQQKDVDTRSLNSMILSYSDQEKINQVGTTIKNAEPQQQTTNSSRNTLPKMNKKSNLKR